MQRNFPRILSVFLLYLLLIAGIVLTIYAPVYAQDSAFTIDYRYNAVLEFFLQKTTEKDYKTAYSYMAGNFPKNHSLEDFTNIINALGLNEFTEKKWTAYEDKMNEIGVVTTKGDFTLPDKTVRKITFYIIIGGETEVKIGDLTEEVQIADLAKRMPETSVWQETVQNDLKKITTFLRGNRVKTTYDYLSNAARKRTKIKEIRDTFRAFKKQKLDIRFPKQGLITIAAGSPQINDQGLMVIQGSYQNSKNIINFMLAYDYEWWKWKLGIFSLSAKAINSAKTK